VQGWGESRLRAEGKLLEIGPGDLSLTLAEAAALLRAAQVTFGEDEVAELHRRTEGWPARLYLAALAELARSNLLLVPLDRRGQWYRYHHLFCDMLLAELGRLEPGVIAVLRRRAAVWCLRNELAEEALEYSIAAGDVDTAARLAEQLHFPVYRQARITTLQRWIGWLEDRVGIEGRPVGAAHAAIIACVTGGRPTPSGGLMRSIAGKTGAARPDDLYAEGLAAEVRTAMCRRGVEQMRADADAAAHELAAANFVIPWHVGLQGIVRILCGDLDGGDAFLQDALSIRKPAPGATAGGAGRPRAGRVGGAGCARGQRAA